MSHRDPEPETRPAISDDNAPLPPAHRPTRWTVRRGRAIAFALLGLALAVSLASVYFTYERAQQSAQQSSAVDRRLSVLEADLADRTRQRDAERDAAAAQAEQDRELFRVRFCELLGELSATFPNLEPVEAALHCAAAVAPANPSGGPGASSQSGGSPPSRVPPTTLPPAADSPDAPAPPSPAPPSEPPSGPGLICGLLPLFC